MTDNVRAELLELAKSVCHGHRGQVSEFIDALVDAGYRKDTSLVAERDALRAALLVARPFVADMPIVGDAVLAQIDAALRQGQ